MKKLLALALSLGAVSALTACGGTPGAVEVLDEFTTTDTINISFAHVSGYVYGSTTERLPMALAYERAVESFEKQYPNINVELEYIEGSYTGLYDYIEGSIITKKQPNITIGYSNNFVEYNAVGAVASLNDFMDHSKWGLSDDDITDFKATGFWAENDCYDSKGTMYSMSLAKSAEAMYVRKDLVEAAGFTLDDLATWDGVAKVGAELKATNALDNDTPFQLYHDTAANYALTLFGQTGAPYITTDGGMPFIDDSKNADSKKALEDHALAYKDYILLRDTSASSSSYGSAMLESNMVWGNIGSTSCQTYYDKIETVIPGAELAILPIPQVSIDKEDHYAVLQGPSMAMLKSEDANENLAAWLFMQHLTTSDVNTDIAVSSGYMPVRGSSYDTAEFKAFEATNTNAVKALAAARSQSHAYKSTPAFIGSNEARTQAGVILLNVFLNGKTLDEAFKIAKEALYLI